MRTGDLRMLGDLNDTDREATPSALRKAVAALRTDEQGTSSGSREP
ncbi:hypothetical protein [Clavibacter sp. VKM Ac-2872]|nr:hypothetical protein [Clavibacter sp. VKM Ac-2872]MBF4623250.1 hypothetical protein [Clavibacter sp. VKM Ac-2872]